MKIPHKRQNGYTLISLIFILGLVAFFVLLLFKVGPIYLDHGKVSSALKDIKETKNLEALGEADIRSSLDKRFNMNYVSDIKAQDIKIIKRGNYLKVEAKYEVVEKIIGNISALVEFNDVVEVGKE